TCLEGGHVYHVEFDPPKQEGVCDVDGSELIVRDDDKPDVIRHRLTQYHDKTEPLISYYDERGILQRVDGTLPPPEVEEKIRALLATLRLEGEV
ncbi:MAG: adenylate kinase, partial [Solirubrobacterales bacterium]|nr:adenylate kinase [Solirubrobacterales bacterium]